MPETPPTPPAPTTPPTTPSELDDEAFGRALDRFIAAHPTTPPTTPPTSPPPAAPPAGDDLERRFAAFLDARNKEDGRDKTITELKAEVADLRKRLPRKKWFFSPLID